MAINKVEFGGNTLIDITDTTAVAADVLSGKYFYTSAGVKTEGTGSGGLSNSDAILSVTVPTGSTVTMTKGAVTLTPTMWTSAATNTQDVAMFIISSSQFDSNSWTVTATHSGDTFSHSLVINSAKEYAVELGITHYLYSAGDTSGWTNLAWKSTSNLNPTSATVTYNANNMTIAQPNAHSSVTYYSRSVDLTTYSGVYCTVSSWAASSNNYNGLYVFSSVSSTDTAYPSAAATYKDKANSSAQTIAVDVSSLSGLYYVGMGTCKTGNTNTNAVITSVYLR